MALNYGVLAYIDYGGAKDFFGRFNISLQPFVQFNASTVRVDLENGEIVAGGSSPSLSATTSALGKYISIIKQWDDILLPGYWDFPDGDIPSDLLLPWANFIAKYGLEDIEPALQLVAGISINSTIPALYNIMNFGTPAASGYLNGTFFDPSPFDNSLIYSKAKLLLAPDLMLATTVLHATRDKNGVTLLVENRHTGARAVIKAKRLLVTFPLTPANLFPLHLDELESKVLGTFTESSLYTAVVQTNIIPSNTSVRFARNVGPYSLEISWNGDPHFFSIILAGGAHGSGSMEALQIIEDTFKKLANSEAFSPSKDETPWFDIVAFSDHSGVVYNQTAQQLQEGLIKQLYALQGHHSTWYTGSVWCSGFSSNVWAFTDTVLPKLLDSVEVDTMGHCSTDVLSI